MRVVVTIEARFTRTPDGAIWTQTGQDHQFWSGYLTAFDQVRAVARVRDVAEPAAEAKRVDGPDVEVWPVPYYLGPYRYLAHRAAIGRAVRASAGPRDAVILRAPSPIGTILAAVRDRLRLPYAMEVVGDPSDLFAPGVVDHPLRPVLRRLYVDRLRRQCRSAVGAAYVTDRFLQSRYPTAPGAVNVAVSDVDLAPVAYVDTARPAAPTRRPTTLISVGSLEQRYKGIDTVIAALAALTATSRAVRLVHIGDGRYRSELVDLARRYGVADRVVFTGALPGGDAVRRELDAADLFVMPSRTEGMPRALIEAMARALPAIGSTVGGIPELLPPGSLVPPDDPGRWADAIAALLDQPERMAADSARNLSRARDFSADLLTARRNAYYRAVAEATAERTGQPTRKRTGPGTGQRGRAGAATRSLA
ncbi:glycosyltransferase [Solwaraspora sp. WMMD406]|uniref:glycosyltransferase n=1 Tax=Solwaraspora sp. WMMD406 TaxID=3016095 RepID=UPI002416281E|nr:glycosyltransferase [Solwaraspora sp. WMMD406]MDG4764776.1 glycosyltransferase [Solwaraspora sp. WMMD406]